MKFKVDENLHPDAAALFRRHGHDVSTVYEQGLQGHADSELAAACQHEQRAIITLDVGFADIRIYPPADYAGIVVLRLEDQSRVALLRVLERAMPLIDTEPLAGHLWVVDHHQVRIRGKE